MNVREHIVFPFCELAEKALRELSDADVVSLSDVNPLPVPFVENVSSKIQKSLHHFSPHSRDWKYSRLSWL